MEKNLQIKSRARRHERPMNERMEEQEDKGDEFGTVKGRRKIVGNKQKTCKSAEDKGRGNSTVANESHYKESETEKYD